MEINNDFELRQEVYGWGAKMFVKAITVQSTGDIEYQLWNPEWNLYSYFSDRQISKEKVNIWFGNK